MRSALSRTAESGRPTMVKASIPLETSASTATPKPCRPFNPKLFNSAYMEAPSCRSAGLFRFVQRVELPHDLRVLQLDDLAGQVMEGVFLGDVQKADPHRAQRLGLCPGPLVGLAVTVFDVPQHRPPQVGQVGPDLVGPPGHQPDFAQ